MKRKIEDTEPTLRKGVENGNDHMSNCFLCKSRGNMQGIRFYQNDVGPVDNPVSYCEYTLFNGEICDMYGCDICTDPIGDIHFVEIIIQAINIKLKIATRHRYVDASWFMGYLHMLGFERCVILDRYYRLLDTDGRGQYVDFVDMPIRVTNEYGGVLQVNWNRLMHALNGNTELPAYLLECQKLEQETGMNIVDVANKKVYNRLEMKLHNKGKNKAEVEAIYKKVMDAHAVHIQAGRTEKFAEDQLAFERHRKIVERMTYLYAGDVARIGMHVELSDQDKRAIKAITESKNFEAEIKNKHEGFGPSYVKKKNDMKDRYEIDLLLDAGKTLDEALSIYKVPNHIKKEFKNKKIKTIAEEKPATQTKEKDIVVETESQEDKDMKEKVRNLELEFEKALNFNAPKEPAKQDNIATPKTFTKKEVKEMKAKNKETIKKKEENKMSKLEGQSASEVVKTLPVKPHTEIHINKVSMEDEQTGLKVTDDAPKNNFDQMDVQALDLYDDGFGVREVENPNSKKEIDEKFEKDNKDLEDEEKKKEKEKQFGYLKLVHKLMDSWSYHYRFNTSGLMAMMASTVQRIVSWAPTIASAAIFFTRLFRARLNNTNIILMMIKDNFDIKSMAMYLAIQYFVWKVLSTVIIAPVYDHKVEITEVEQVPQQVDDEKREYDTNFKTTKLETKIHFTEKSTIGLMVHTPFSNSLLPYHVEETEHTASGELVANMLTPVNVNSTISPVSLLERMAKSTNLGSFIDYDRSDAFFEDTVNGSERLAVAVALSSRCKSMLTSVYNQVFQSTGDMMLLPVKNVQQRRRGVSIWMRKPSPHILDGLHMDIGQMRLRLRNSLFRITPLTVLQKICSYTMHLSAHLWRLARFLLTYLLYYLDPTLLILILLSTVSLSGWLTTLRLMTNF